MSPITINEEELFSQASQAKEQSYSVYSRFRVGAALLTDDNIYYQGCNVENFSYGATICAERTAYVKAVSDGHKKFVAVAVTSDQEEFVSPCGICRQFLSEFGPSDLPVYLFNVSGKLKKMTLQELLPSPFALDSGDMPRLNPSSAKQSGSDA